MHTYGSTDGRQAPETPTQREWKRARERDAEKLALVRESALAHNQKLTLMIQDDLAEKQLFERLQKRAAEMRAADPNSLPPAPPPEGPLKNIVRLRLATKVTKYPPPKEKPEFIIKTKKASKFNAKFIVQHSVVVDTNEKNQKFYKPSKNGMPVANAPLPKKKKRVTIIPGY